ncbi:MULTISPECIES: ABC transporter ATP-binding protein [unclassified Microbacterium]|uniref:ABC transporter ATP-binding protein n=1 Tax=unclassified Microbacterium TaxID=2609290 RepID=UPI001DA75A40|nr:MULTISPECIES: ABC transporter ATP-binding protein [unclassified Microbacterium]CAH0167704.1 Aliphatic sulfonates import ATP-binding protein SsuB [Microbacterium sp. Bi121]HWK78093.1 ABC transporter ATP-binding protein [Microbacterium sp.]
MSSALLSSRTETVPPAGAATAVRLESVERRFAVAEGQRQVLRGLDVDLGAGEIVAVVGPSGCGKSTLLRLVAGLDTPTGGIIAIDGTGVTDTDERTAVAFQEPRLLPWRTLAQNVALGLPRRLRGRARTERVSELLRLVGLEHAANQRPREVSGGMAQRASLARALARNPSVLLLDEPFGALDALTRLRMQDLLLDIHAAEPTTILLVTHDVEEALYLADRVLLLRSLTVDPDPDAASIARTIAVPGIRPRDRADRGLAALRAELLEGLGVDTHHSATDHSTDLETR